MKLVKIELNTPESPTSAFRLKFSVMFKSAISFTLTANGWWLPERPRPRPPFGKTRNKPWPLRLLFIAKEAGTHHTWPRPLLPPPVVLEYNNNSLSVRGHRRSADTVNQQIPMAIVEMDFVPPCGTRKILWGPYTFSVFNVPASRSVYCRQHLFCAVCGFLAKQSW